MLFMVIEKFKDDKAKEVYYRYQQKGRMLPDGLKYIDSWVEVNLNRCFQLMECDDLTLFQKWILEWQDLVEFEVIPVVTSQDADKVNAQINAVDDIDIDDENPF
ncbi:MAG: DUF3303 family protein [Cyanobacteria bacterium J06573_2]